MLRGRGLQDLAQDAQGGSAVPEDPEKVVVNDVKDSTPVEEEQQAVGAEDAAAPVADEEPPADDATPEVRREGGSYLLLRCRPEVQQ